MPQSGNRAARADAPPRHSGPRRNAAGALIESCGRAAAARTSSEAAGSRAVARRWSRPGPRRDATRRRLGRTPLPCREQSRQPSKARRAGTGLAAAAGTACRSRRFGRQREERRGHHAARLRVRRIPEGTADCPLELSYPTPAPHRGARSALSRAGTAESTADARARDGAPLHFPHIANKAERAVADGAAVACAGGSTVALRDVGEAVLGEQVVARLAVERLDGGIGIGGKPLVGSRRTN